MFTFNAEFELPSVPKPFKDVGIVEYCSVLPSGCKWPRMSKSKRARIKLASVAEGYAGAYAIQQVEDSKFIEIVQAKARG